MGITGILNAYVAYYGKKKIIAFFTVIIILFVGVFIIKNSDDESKKKFVAVENGRAAYKLIETHYENSDVTLKDGKLQWYETFDNTKIIKYKHCRIGKPKYVIIYQTMIK